MLNNKSLAENDSQFIIYQTDAGQTKIEVRLENETVWLTQKLMAELFQVKPQNITMHLKNIYLEDELEEMSTCKNFLHVQIEGNRKVQRQQKFYNLDAIISIGYRVQSKEFAENTYQDFHKKKISQEVLISDDFDRAIQKIKSKQN